MILDSQLPCQGNCGDWIHPGLPSNLGFSRLFCWNRAIGLPPRRPWNLCSRSGAWTRRRIALLHLCIESIISGTSIGCRSNSDTSHNGTWHRASTISRDALALIPETREIWPFRSSTAQSGSACILSCSESFLLVTNNVPGHRLPFLLPLLQSSHLSSTSPRSSGVYLRLSEHRRRPVSVS
jgi:hypothetical protein